MDEATLDVIAVGPIRTTWRSARRHPGPIGRTRLPCRHRRPDRQRTDPRPPGPEARLQAKRAAEILGVQVRVTLELPNRRLFDTFEARGPGKQLRKYRRLVLGLGDRTPMASPDHYQAMLITEAAVFYSKLTKWDEYFETLPTYTVPVYMHYFLAFRSLSPVETGGLVVDISDTLEKKIAAITCYETQFPPEKRHVLDRVRIFNQQQGLAAGFSAGETIAPRPSVSAT